MRPMTRNQRMLSYALEMAPMRDGWACAEADGWLMEDQPGLDRTVQGLKQSLRALERRGTVQLRTGSDGRLYARHAHRAGLPTETAALTGGKGVRAQ